jgi:Arc/MetJ-type ribon-helix-helix transcriptional regulator
MTLTLDAATEKRIQREIDLGHYANPAEVVAHAVARLVGETQTERDEQKPSSDTDDRIMSWAGVDGVEYQRRIRSEWPD